MSDFTAYLGPVQFTPGEFENRDFILKTDQMFYFNTTQEKFENETTTAHWGRFVFEENLDREVAWLSRCRRPRKVPPSTQRFSSTL